MTLVSTFIACDILCRRGSLHFPEMFISFCIKGFVIFTKKLTKPFNKEHEIFIFLWCTIIFIFFWIYFQSHAFGFLLLTFMFFKSFKFKFTFLEFSEEWCERYGRNTFLLRYSRHVWFPFSSQRYYHFKVEIIIKVFPSAIKWFVKWTNLFCNVTMDSPGSIQKISYSWLNVFNLDLLTSEVPSRVSTKVSHISFADLH